MPKPSKNTFNCKLNKKYLEALNYKTKEMIDPKAYRNKICEQFWITKERFEEDPEYWIAEYEDRDYYEGSSTNCCGIDELCFDDLVNYVDSDTPEIRSTIAKHINKLNNSDKRILITGLPLKNSDGHDSSYNFKNYKILRDILFDFGFKQTHTRLYKNANSRNMLAVLVGQMPG